MLPPHWKPSAAHAPSWAALLLAAAGFAGGFPAYAERRLVSVGDRRLSIDCEGHTTRQTVVLIAGLGRTAEDWTKV